MDSLLGFTFKQRLPGAEKPATARLRPRHVHDRESAGAAWRFQKGEEATLPHRSEGEKAKH